MSPPDTSVVGRVRAVMTGTVRPFGRSTSGIDKRARQGAVTVAADGFDGDAQADLRVHGGADKAVHCYPWAHYPAWQAELPPDAPGRALLDHPGAFGENLSIAPGLDETGVHLGERWRIGTAEFEVSQGRQPCWKLNTRFGVPDMSRRVQESRRAGWYLRVLQPGAVQAGDTIVRLAHPHPNASIDRLLRVIAERDCDPRTLRELLALPLPPSWHKLFHQRLERGEVESWTRRLDGDA